MIIVEKQKLVTSLIKSDLIFFRLMGSMTSVGISLDDRYCLHLNDTIFELMGYCTNDHSDEVFREYVITAEAVATINLQKETEELDLLAHELYKMLLQKTPKH